jgi:plastocyanin
LNPSNIAVPIGTEIKWTNEDELDHTITSGIPSRATFDEVYDGRFYSVVPGSGDSFTYEFTELGVYHYFCSPHP